MDDSTPDALERALAAWRRRGRKHRAERDPLVLAASAAGIGKSRIHEMTGISRTTIDQILRQEP